MAIKEKLWTANANGLPCGDYAFNGRVMLSGGYLVKGGNSSFVDQQSKGTLIFKEGGQVSSVDLYPAKSGLSLWWLERRLNLAVKIVVLLGQTVDRIAFMLDGWVPDPRGERD